MFRLPSAALAAMLTLITISPALAQDLDRTDPQSLPASSAGGAALDSDIVVRDSTRAVLAEDEARIQADQARLDSLESARASAREAVPRDPAAVTRTAEAVRETRRAVAREVGRTRRDRSRLAALERKVIAESDGVAGRSAETSPERAARQ
jgi:hypothetical protein